MNEEARSDREPGARSRREDRALVDAVLSGDRAALDDWLDLASIPLYRFVHHRLGGSATDCEEIVQETFVSAMESLHRFEGRSSLQTWLQGIAKNHIARHRRRAARERVAGLLESHDQEIEAIVADLSRSMLPDEILERVETEELVGATMASLPPHYQELLRAKYHEGLAVEEIAERQRATPKAVESSLGRARRAFKKTFELLAGKFGGGWRHA